MKYLQVPLVHHYLSLKGRQTRYYRYERCWGEIQCAVEEEMSLTGRACLTLWGKRKSRREYRESVVTNKWTLAKKNSRWRQYKTGFQDGGARSWGKGARKLGACCRRGSWWVSVICMAAVHRIEGRKIHSDIIYLNVPFSSFSFGLEAGALGEV